MENDGLGYAVHVEIAFEGEACLGFGNETLGGEGNNGVAGGIEKVRTNQMTISRGITSVDARDLNGSARGSI
jgi:hypothetical protein